MPTNGLSSRMIQFLDPEDRNRVGIQTPFQRLALQMQDILGDGGILKDVLREGEGPLVPRDASISIHFSGFLEYSDQPFESTRSYKFPKMMKLGKDMTVWGLDLGLRTMRRGEFARFLIQPSYAYGEMGCPPLIPPLASVLYEVQVFDYLDSAQVDEFFALSPEEQNLAPLSTLLNVVNTERSFGNRCFNQSRYDDAKYRYKQAMTLLRNRKPEDEEERRHVEEASLPFLLNLSLAYFRLERPHKALKFGQRALQISPGNTKALFRCGQACLEMNEYEKAQEYLIMAQAKKPFDTDINNSLKKLANCYKEHLDQEKLMCSKMFSAFKSEN
ncbi:Inactive peptidyl-prolyl cis-trans isomerase FKBP6 [Bagarius yarrelli]|uniref:peptidylprolyl isomerase n=1 Tax=Bagarius yarrelli TaxID=175774 RepID=A0A556TYN7_BAGYA|nr:Inactive peptidyl-prolyl cis-trans isomerase FKBP6 [Bagarius yarrelli]